MDTAVLAVLCLIAPGVVVPDPPRATVRGRVVDAQTAEPLTKVKVIAGRGHETSSDAAGLFSISDLEPGEIELLVTAVGYGIVKRTIHLADGDNDVHDIALHQEATAVTEYITVSAPDESPLGSDPAARARLNKAELQALSMVLVGDPLRAAQTLPGIVANSDLRSDFAVRGAGFERVSVYVDGVATDRFIHTLGEAGTTDQLSLAVINQDTVSNLTLFNGAFPSAYGDSNAAVLAIETRDGSRVRNAVRVSTGFLSTAAVIDGPLARGRGSWLVGARTSRFDYLQRFVERVTGTADDDGDDRSSLDFSDLQAKAVFDVSRRHQIGASLLTGLFAQNANERPSEEGQADPNASSRSDSRNRLLTAYWRFTPGARSYTQARVFALRSDSITDNAAAVTLEDEQRHDTGIRVDTAVVLSSRHYVEAGTYLRFAHGRARSLFVPPSDVSHPRTVADYDERSVDHAYFVQDTWGVRPGKLTVTAGGRLEHWGRTGQTLFSPRVAVVASLGPDWRLRGAWGRYFQAPAPAELFGFLGNRDLHAAAATHYNAAVERRLTARTWAVVEVYDREDTNQIFSLSEPRVENGVVTSASEPFRNALDGYARGVEITVQRRSANGLMGWLSYAYALTSLRDERHGLVFPSDADQRHTVNMFASYRFTETLALTGVWRYGSATPRRGFLEMRGETLTLGAERNRLRAPTYSRVDARLSKAFRVNRAKLTISAEVLNVLNRTNEYNVQSSIVRLAQTGTYTSGLRRSFPLLPTLGVALEF